MPRLKRTVKYILSPGFVDIHFHGAFGIDLMVAESTELTFLAKELFKNGIAAFCPTTLSTSHQDLLGTVARLGAWILASRKLKPKEMAFPLGIHLEGPFIHPKSAGAHPPDVIRPLNLKEIKELWIASGKTLKIITLAPETLAQAELNTLCKWARNNKIVLSLGHSQATEAQATSAFSAGVQGVTHAWNALKFHHREPGALGAAIGRKNTYIEIIPDLKHVDPTLIRWTCALHHPNPICFVSDCAPAAATTEGWHSFGPLQTTYSDGACHLPNQALAGGGLLLTESYRKWVEQEALFKKEAVSQILKRTLPYVTHFPLKAVGGPVLILRTRQIRWTLKGKFHLTCAHHSG